jgi:hypothetical protein
MKAIALKNGMVIFVEQIAFIHVQPSSAKDNPIVPEIHIHFAAGLYMPTGGRSMRVVVKEENAQDLLSQLERHGVPCSHVRERMAEIK